MFEDPGTIASGIHLLFCTKNIENGDHTTNIAESVQYIIEGYTLLSGQRPSATTDRL
jgi:phosphate transport system protein